MIRRALAIAGIGIMLAVAFVTPASAHPTTIFWRSHQAGVDGHTSIWVQDQVCNPGQVVFAQYYVSTIGGLVAYNLYAPCVGTARRDHYPQQITRYRICEVNIGCSAWTST
jgi:hypothetical protein